MQFAYMRQRPARAFAVFPQPRSAAIVIYIGQKPSQAQGAHAAPNKKS